jgi:DNA-binding transcriptional ArsR family regulator
VGQQASRLADGYGHGSGQAGGARGHPLRAALLELLAGRDTLTATQAAGELGESSGACSFHLRQLERYGLVEEAPGRQGRARPWRLTAPAPPAGDSREYRDAEFGELARELENEGYRRWLAGRRTAPPDWHDEAFSTVLYLTPAELTQVATAIRAVIAPFGDRDRTGTAAIPVAVVARMFPLLPATSDG